MFDKNQQPMVAHFNSNFPNINTFLNISAYIEKVQFAQHSAIDDPSAFRREITGLYNAVSVECVQLTDNVTLSTAGAVKRFIESCSSAILQANNVSNVEAIENNATATFATENDATRAELMCPYCTIPNLASSMCCNSGTCNNGTCQCNAG